MVRCASFVTKEYDQGSLEDTEEDQEGNADVGSLAHLSAKDGGDGNAGDPKDYQDGECRLKLVNLAELLRNMGANVCLHHVLHKQE